MGSQPSRPVAPAYPGAPAPVSEAVISGPASLKGFGEHCFYGSVAEKYLGKQGVKYDHFTAGMWVHEPEVADKVAAAVLEWAKDNGANTYCHWFQPMCATQRHGQTGQVQNAMFEFDGMRQPIWELKGKHLLRGETDGSSFPNGGLRATHTAGGYLTIDPKSPIFLRTDSIFIPACFVAYTGLALDEKTPLHRAEGAMSAQGARLFKLLGHNIAGMLTNIGLEQELFFVPSSAYYKRPDLQMCGRTVLGASPAQNQEGCTHYMAPINTTKSVFACMQEIQQECYKLGIPLKTRHREVAPNQYEFAPLFGHVIEQTDNNLMVMQIMEEVAPKHGLRALLHEKPFAGVNGSGKHNNWSISTLCGAQLLNPGDLAKKMKGDTTLFPIVSSFSPHRFPLLFPPPPLSPCLRCCAAAGVGKSPVSSPLQHCLRVATRRFDRGSYCTILPVPMLHSLCLCTRTASCASSVTVVYNLQAVFPSFSLSSCFP